MTSARRSLRDRLDAARREAYVDLACPVPFDGWYVRCRALTAEEISTAGSRHEGKPDAAVHSNIDALVLTCLGVWEELDGQGVSPIDGFTGRVDLRSGALTGALPTFSSPELAEALEVEPAAEAVVRQLLAHPSDAALLQPGEALVDFSMNSNEKVTRAARGN